MMEQKLVELQMQAFFGDTFEENFRAEGEDRQQGECGDELVHAMRR